MCFCVFLSTLKRNFLLVKLKVSFQAGTKLVCAVLSLPLPSKCANPCGEQVNSLVCRTVPEYLEQRTLQKLLLIGYSGSGTSTIFKQVITQWSEIFMFLTLKVSIWIKSLCHLFLIMCPGK